MVGEKLNFGKNRRELSIFIFYPYCVAFICTGTEYGTLFINYISRSILRKYEYVIRVLTANRYSYFVGIE